jgi:predicted small lipoprotein YifL
VSKAIIGSLLVLTLLALLAGCGKQGSVSKAPAGSAQPTESHPLPAAAYTAVDLSGIKKAEGGMTVAELFADKEQLAGKQVVVRGKVVKTSANIMGKNWVHVRDGTGAEKTNDLTVTTSDPPPTIGTTVVVTGQLSRNKDLGLGYRYDVLIEDAKLKTE